MSSSKADPPPFETPLITATAVGEGSSGASGFAGKARSAVIWNAGFNLFRDLLQFVTMLVLVRLLPPRAYGEFGFVTSVVGFMSIFAFGNFIAHALQVKDAKDARFQEHFTAGAVLNIGMFCVANLVAFALRTSSEWAQVAPLLHVMSLTFLLEWPCEVRRKMIEREFDWKTLRILHGIGLALTALLAIGMALGGFGTYALLVPGLAVTLPFICDLFVRMRWRPTWEWSWSSYKPAAQFGVTRIGSGLVLNGRQLMESAVFASILGFAALGVFNRSIGLAQLFCGKVASQLVYAIYPILTRIDNKEANAARVGGLVIQTVAWSAIPLATAFAVLAGPFVRLIYGENWLAVIPLVPWAMGWGVAAALFHATYMLLLARQQQRWCLIADAAILLGTALALFAALPFGMRPYLIAATAVQVLGLVLVTFWLWKVNGLRVAAWVSSFGPAAVAAAAGALAIHLAVPDLLAGRTVSVALAIALGGAFMLVYVLMLRLCFKRQLLPLLPYLPARTRIQKLLLLSA